MTYIIYTAAAVFEIAGCFTFWAWLRMAKPVWWLAPGMVSLALFAWLLTFVPSEAAGRTFAAYRHLYRGFSDVAVDRREPCARPLGHWWRARLPLRLGNHPTRTARLRRLPLTVAGRTAKTSECVDVMP